MASSSEERDDFETKSEPGSDVDMKSESSDGDVEFVQWLKTSADEEEVKSEPGRQLSFVIAPWLLFRMKRCFLNFTVQVYLVILVYNKHKLHFTDSVEIRKEPSSEQNDLTGLMKYLADRYKHEQDQQQKENDELKKKLMNSESLNTKLRADLILCKCDNENLRAKITRQEKDEKTRIQQLELSTRLQGSLEADLDRCRKDRKSLKAKVSSLKKDKKWLKRKLKKCDAVQEDHESTTSRYIEDINWLMELVKKIKSERDALQEQMEQQRKKKVQENFGPNAYAKDEVDVTWLMDKIEQFRSERDDLQSRVDDQCTNIDQIQADLSRRLRQIY